MSKTLGLRPFERASLRLDDPRLNWTNFVLCGSDPEGDPEGGQGGDGDSGDGGGDDPGGDGDDPDADKDRNPAARRAAEEAKQTRLKLRQTEAERDELQRYRDEAERAKLSENERATAELTEAKGTITSLTDTNRRLAIENAFFKSNDVSWRNPATALKLMDLSKVEVKDGEVKNPEALTEAIKALAQSDAYLVADKTDDDSKTKDKPNARPSGEPPKDKNKGDGLDKATLQKKYPGLATH